MPPIKIEELYNGREGEHSCGDIVREGVFYFRRASGGYLQSVYFWTECQCGEGRSELSPTRAAALRRIARILGASAPSAILVNSDGGSYCPFE